MARQPAPLPDLSDEDIKRRLEPLAAQVLPSRGPTKAPAAKPPRKGIEFLLPEPVVTELKTRAAQRGITATTLIMELLQREGYPVTEADFTDLRKQPRR